MFNRHDINEIHTYLEDPFPHFQTDPIAATNPTKMNNIIPIIPEPVRNIMDFTLLVGGTSLNALLALIIVSNSSMYNSTNCYIVSLALSNLTILLEPFQQVFRWIFKINLMMNLDYIFLVSFGASILTIIILNIEAYVVICQKYGPLHKSFVKISTAIKGILFIWIMCIMLTAMELHLYDHFEKEIVYDIYVSSTVMFLIFPCFIFIMLDCFILYDLVISKSIIGTWPSKDIERFTFLVGITTGFFLTMIPYRIVRAIDLLTISCCSDTTIELVYTMVKIYPMILPIIYFIISKEFHQVLKTMLCCRQHKTTVIV
ncbi:pyrokinin-1 receptor-like [Nylanderia fulva]|uniref:pyrokinin-1 receptor-like n=1 Tax=Nylanderia fulva TaxID=613905 RepID=UPI0010FBAEC6|nr:pyrokinin-1 receptor-like [Nylanderia fulva]